VTKQELHNKLSRAVIMQCHHEHLIPTHDIGAGNSEEWLQATIRALGLIEPELLEDLASANMLVIKPRQMIEIVR
jgi:hypothetical protein